MKINKVLSSYPILDVNRRDYLGALFDAQLTDYSTESTIILQVKFTLENVPEITGLIDRGEAVYAVHLSCSATSYRKTFKTNQPEITVEIPASELFKELEISTFIVAATDIKDYQASTFNPIYQTMKNSFDIKKHQILAIGPQYEHDLQGAAEGSEDSIIYYRKLTSKKQQLKVMADSTEDYIVIGLSEQLFNQVVTLERSGCSEIIFSMVIVPAMVVVLKQLILEREDPNLQTTTWYQVLVKALKRHGYDVNELSVESDDLLEIAQIIFDYPLGRAMLELDDFSKGELADED